MLFLPGKISIVFILLFCCCYLLNAQSNYNGATIQIGSQLWMAENLNTDKYWDDAPIPEAKTPREWKEYCDKKIGCYCNYDNEPCYGQMYGKLYNWYAIKRGVAPHCWRMPSRADFDILLSKIAGPGTGKKMKGMHSWSSTWNGDNTSKFNALAGGCRNENGTFSYVGREAFWWTIETRKLGNDRESGLHFFINYDDTYNYDLSEGFGYSVRCMRDVNQPPPNPCP